MAQTKNIWNLEVNDTIEVTYNSGHKKSFLVTRITENSWYVNNGRNSYGTLQKLLNNAGEVIKCEILKNK
jgi:hypothetical protein